MDNLISIEGELTRRDTRSLIFHILYAAEAHDYQEPLGILVNDFNEGFDLSIKPNSDVMTTVQAVVNHRDDLDKIYEPFLDNWRADRISVCSKLILRFGVWELCYTTTPAQIVINEAVELAKSFAEDDAYRFVNGILDRVAHQYRVNEMQPQDVE